jgi:hypothetical protein
VATGSTVAGGVGVMCVGGLVDTINHYCVGAKRFWISDLVPSDITQIVPCNTRKPPSRPNGMLKIWACFGCNMAFRLLISPDLSGKIWGNV